MKDAGLSAHVADPARLAALRAVALLDTPTEESFDRLTRLAARFVNAPVSLVSLVDADRQFFKSSLGLPEPWLSRRETPLSHSFCQHNRIASQPLLVKDARRHPMFKSNPAIQDLNVVAYLGIPLVTSDGYVLGSFCVIDSKPREWSEEEIGVVQKLAASVMTEIHLRTEIKERRQVEERLAKQNEALRQAYADLEQETAQRLQALEHLRHRDQMLMQQSRLAAMGEMAGYIAHQWRQPLNMLALVAQELPITLKRGSFSVEYLEASIKKMMQSISAMSRSIDDFRNFFRPSGEKVSFSVLDAVQQAVSLFNNSLNRGEIRVSLSSESNPAVTGYPNEYAQVVLNILLNARDALVTRKVADAQISIRIGLNGARSLVTVTDNAGGIPGEVGEKIFDPYFSTKGPESGTGMGLYLAKMIIENHMSGSLSVENVAGGAQFRIVV